MMYQIIYPSANNFWWHIIRKDTPSDEGTWIATFTNPNHAEFFLASLNSGIELSDKLAKDNFYV